MEDTTYYRQDQTAGLGKTKIPGHLTLSIVPEHNRRLTVGEKNFQLSSRTFTCGNPLFYALLKY